MRCYLKPRFHPWKIKSLVSERVELGAMLN